MSFSYDNSLPTNRDYVRFLTGDTVSATEKFSNEEIDAALADETATGEALKYFCAARLLELLMRRWAGRGDGEIEKQIGTLRIRRGMTENSMESLVGVVASLRRRGAELSQPTTKSKYFAVYLLALVVGLGVSGGVSEAQFFWQQFLPPVDTVDDLPTCGGVYRNRSYYVREPENGSWYYCPTSGSEWLCVAGEDCSGGGGGEGTVTSVGLSVPTGFTISGSPITTSGTFTLGLSTQAANRVWAGPTTGADAAPTFRALVSADVPNNAADTTGNAATATALAANGANCSAGSAPLGVDASGAAEGCFAVATATHASTHSDGGADEITVENLATACASGQVIEGDGAGGLQCGTDDTGGGGSGLWDQETSTKVSLDVNNDSDYDAYIESPNSTRLRLKQEGANESGRGDAASIELRHLVSGYGARIGIDNTAADFFVDVESASTERQNALYIQAATGRVGMGTASPSQRLHVRNTGAAFGLFDNATNSVGFGFGSGTAAAFIESNTDLLFLRSASYGATGSGVGTETLRTTSTGAKVTGILAITPRASAPGTCTIGDIYVDTSGAYCGCVSTNTWENLGVTGSCT